jgi:hypothetical protein
VAEGCIQFSIVIQFCAVVLLSAQTPKPDFTGRWEVDKSLSTARITFVKHPEFHGPPAPLAPAGHEFDTMRPQTITHRDPSLAIVDEPARAPRPRRFVIWSQCLNVSMAPVNIRHPA